MRNLKRWVFYIMAACMFFMQASCAFYIRQNTQLPEEIHHVNLSSFQKYGQLTYLLRKKLAHHHLKTTEENTPNIPSLHISNDSLEHAPLSLYADGSVAEYELLYHVDFSVHFKGYPVQSHQVFVRRKYMDSTTTSLAKKREVDGITLEMRESATQLILKQLIVDYYSHTAPIPPPD
jgi:LPS-assembly lipoprotein